MGRIGALGRNTDNAGHTLWSTMDLFRYSAPGVRDYSDGLDGQAAYFSVDGSTLTLPFNNQYSGSARVNNGDTADYNVLDVFGFGSPGDSLTLSATDIENMNVLGWNPVPPPAVIIESFGSTSLTQIGNNYFLYANGTSTGPELKVGGAAVVTGLYSGWAPIGGEQTSSGYEVAWKNAALGHYTVWSVDGNGNGTASVIGEVAGSDAALESIETSFHQDLNGDGVIGVPAAASSGLQPVTPTIVPPTITIAPSSGNAVLSGSAASDTFVFGPHFGNDTIVNFQLGTDQVNVDHTLFASLSDILFHTANDANGNAVITVTTDQSITIQDASKQLLLQHLTDFHLV